MEKMKKFALVMALVMAFMALTACSGSQSLDGTWKVTNMSGDGLDLGIDGLDVEQLFSSGLIEITLTFSKGTVTMAMSALGQTQSENSSYTVSGNKVTIDGDTMTYKINGSKLTLEMDGGVMTLERK